MLTTIHARADFYTQSEEAARNFTDQTSTFLALFHSIQANTAPGPGDADVKAVFDSIKVTQKGDRAEVTATIPPSFLRKLVNEPARQRRPGRNRARCASSAPTRSSQGGAHPVANVGVSDRSHTSFSWRLCFKRRTVPLVLTHSRPKIRFHALPDDQSAQSA